MRILALLALSVSACAGSAPHAKPPAAPPAAVAPPAAAEGEKVPPATDLVSAISAGGVDQTQGLDWSPDKAAQPSDQAFKNAKVLGSLPAERLMLAMQSMAGNLGVDCGHCHGERDFADDDKKPKQTARAMMRMAYEIDHRYFKGETRVSCYTCHRRDATPDTFKPEKKLPEWPLPQLAAADAQKPAKEVYKNLKVLGDMPAGHLGDLMLAFSGAIGTGCIHCHNPENWAADDKPAKQTARGMLAMVHEINEGFFPAGKGGVRCGTCHRGQVEPARNAGPMVQVVGTLAAGGSPPRASFVLGPASFPGAKTRGELRKLLTNVDEAQFMRGRARGGGEAQLGHAAPGTYMLCGASVPEDPSPQADPKGPERPVACAPVTITAEPAVQTIKRELPPL